MNYLWPSVPRRIRDKLQQIIRTFNSIFKARDPRLHGDDPAMAGSLLKHQLVHKVSSDGNDDAEKDDGGDHR
jgi:hypothetical protein